MALVKCPDCGKEISNAAPACPNCGRPSAIKSAVAKKKKNIGSSLAIGCLVIPMGVICLVILAFLLFGGGHSPSTPNISHTSSAPDTSNTAPSVSTGPLLELITFSWHTEHGYAILEGQVKNISINPLRNVTAVATFYDASGGFITSHDALIEYDPILPGQVSPFKVMATKNPAMKKAGVEFKELMGGAIEYRQAEGRKR